MSGAGGDLRRRLWHGGHAIRRLAIRAGIRRVRPRETVIPDGSAAPTAVLLTGHRRTARTAQPRDVAISHFLFAPVCRMRSMNASMASRVAALVVGI